jgi:hypothetical protein
MRIQQREHERRHAHACAAVQQAWQQLCMADIIERIKVSDDVEDYDDVHLIDGCCDTHQGTILVRCYKSGPHRFNVHFVKVCAKVIDRPLGLVYEKRVSLPPCVVHVGNDVKSIVKFADGSIALTLTDRASGAKQRMRVSVRV